MAGHREPGVRTRPRRLDRRHRLPAAGPAFGREDRERAQDDLADGATRAVGAGRRAVAEEPDPYRTCFERDRDRILHSLVVPPAGGQDPGVHLPGRPPTDPAHPRARGGPGRHRHRPCLSPQRGAHRGDRPRSRLRPRTRRARQRGRSRHLPDRRLRPCRVGSRRLAGRAEPLCRDARRDPQPLVVAPGPVDARRGGRELGRPHRLRLSRLGGRRLGRHRDAGHAPRRRPSAVRRDPVAPAPLLHPGRDERHVVVGPGGDGRGAGRRPGRRSARATTSRSTSARRRCPRARPSSPCSAASSSTSPTNRTAFPGWTTAGGSPAGSAEAVQAAVAYVAGMTDRFAMASAVTDLGWDRRNLPRGIEDDRSRLTSRHR